MDLKYEEAFFKAENRNITLAELNHLYDKNLQSFVINIRNNLYCPKCHQAKLVYVNGDERYLRTHPKAQHINCDLEQDIIPLKRVKAYVKNRKNASSIKRQKESILRMLMDTPCQLNPNTEVVEAKDDNFNQESEPKKQKEESRFLRLSQKRIDHKLRDEDYNVYKFFYGEVLIQWEGLNEDGKRLLLRDKVSGRFLCRIKVSSTVFHYIPSEWITENRRPGYIVVLGEMKIGAEAKWPCLVLEDSDFLSIALV